MTKSPWSQTEKISKCWRIDPFSLYVLSSVFRPLDGTPENRSFQKLSFARASTSICMYILWKDKTQIALRTSRGVKWENKTSQKGLLQPRAATALVRTEFSSEMWESLNGTTLLHYLFRRQVFHSTGYLVRVVYKIWYIQSYLWVTRSRSPGCFINISLVNSHVVHITEWQGYDLAWYKHQGGLQCFCVLQRKLEFSALMPGLLLPL